MRELTETEIASSVVARTAGFHALLRARLVFSRASTCKTRLLRGGETGLTSRVTRLTGAGRGGVILVEAWETGCDAHTGRRREQIRGVAGGAGLSGAGAGRTELETF